MPQFASFEVDGLLFGLNVRLVQEVLHDQPLTPVPQAPPEVFGLINLRGQIVVAVDLATCLGRTRQGDSDDAKTDARHLAGRLVILQTAGEPIALIVASLGDVLTVHASRYEACAGLLDEPLDDLIVGAYRLDDRLLHVLDPTALMATLTA